jgi:hypothetical protein
MTAIRRHVVEAQLSLASLTAFTVHGLIAASDLLQRFEDFLVGRAELALKKADGVVCPVCRRVHGSEEFHLCG